MSAERYNPGFTSAAMSLHHGRMIDRQKAKFDNSLRSQNQLKEAIEPSELFREVRIKLSVGAPLSSLEKQKLKAIINGGNLPLTG